LRHYSLRNILLQDRPLRQTYYILYSIWNWLYYINLHVWLPSILGIKFSSDLGIPGCPLLCKLIRRDREGIRHESKHVFKAGLIYGTISLFLSLSLFSLFRFFGRRTPAILYMKIVPIVEGLVIGLNAGFFEEALCRLFLLTIFTKMFYELFKRKHLKALIFMRFHHYYSPFGLIGSTKDQYL